MHGYIDTIDIPLHLPASAFKPSTSSSSSTSNNHNNNNNKGKGKATPQEGQYDVVANWTPNDRKEVERMVKMASIRSLSLLSLLYKGFHTRTEQLTEHFSGGCSRILYFVVERLNSTNF